MSIFRREDQQPATPATGSNTPPEPRSRPQNVTLVAPGSVVEGKIGGTTEVLVEGVLEGEVDLGSTLVVGEGGKVIGNVVAHSVRIAGELIGNVQALDKVELLPSGSIHGDVRSPRVAIAEGGFCKGKIEMGPQGPRRTEEADAPSTDEAAAKADESAESEPEAAPVETS